MIAAITICLVELSVLSNITRKLKKFDVIKIFLSLKYTHLFPIGLCPKSYKIEISKYNVIRGSWGKTLAERMVNQPSTLRT
jgi:hypothetical protein